MKTIQSAARKRVSIPAFFMNFDIMPDKASLVIKMITDLVEPILDEMGFELVDVLYLSKHGRWVLRITIDSDGGVTINDCARVSGEISDLLDVKEIIEHEYVLEVSSPGLNRTLKKERDFIRAIGKKIKVRMAIPVNGQRNFTGHLNDFQNSTLYVEGERGMVELPWQEIEKANLVYEF